jgi:hypothetical protein
VASREQRIRAAANRAADNPGRPDPEMAALLQAATTPPAYLPPTLTVRFSEVHWYTVNVPTAELYEAYGADVAGMTGPVDDYPDEDAALAVHELLTRCSIDQSALIETDGMEVHSVRRPGQPEGSRER